MTPLKLSIVSIIFTIGVMLGLGLGLMADSESSDCPPTFWEGRFINITTYVKNDDGNIENRDFTEDEKNQLVECGFKPVR